jgi:hypothetical protein
VSTWAAHSVRFALCTLILAACNGARPPVISSFTAEPDALPAGGGNVTLRWAVTGADGLTIEPGIGPVTGASLLVNVTSSRTFTLSATSAGGSVSAQAEVTVAGGPDRTPPTVAAVSPEHGAAGVTADALIRVTFSEAMDRAATEAAYASDSPGLRPAEVEFAWNDAGTVLGVTPTAPLAYAEGNDYENTAALHYAITFDGGARDLAGNSLAPFTFAFTTLRRLTLTLSGDPAQDGGVEGGVVSNGLIDFQVSTTSRGFVGFDLSGLPETLDPAGLEGATLRVNAQSPMVFTTEVVEVEHVLYGPTLIAPAATTAALRNVGALEQEPPVSDAWKTADVLAAVREDLVNRTPREERSQYRLRCTGCSVTFFAAEVADTDGDARFKLPELRLVFLVP